NSVEPITQVTFGDIDNSSTNDASETEGYIDNTDQETSVIPGQTYTITLNGNTEGFFTNYFTVFIDLNENGILDDFGEVFEIGSITDTDGTDEDAAITGQIEIPVTTSPGNKRMRVYKNYNSSETDPCANDSYGQIQDYTVVVEALEDCEGQ